MRLLKQIVDNLDEIARYVPVDNVDDGDGTWITINGAHIFIKDGDTVKDSFKRTTGKSLSSSDEEHHQGTLNYYKSVKEKTGIDPTSRRIDERKKAGLPYRGKSEEGDNSILSQITKGGAGSEVREKANAAIKRVGAAAPTIEKPVYVGGVKDPWSGKGEKSGAIREYDKWKMTGGIEKAKLKASEGSWLSKFKESNR